jgi:hypothetical protein
MVMAAMVVVTKKQNKEESIRDTIYGTGSKPDNPNFRNSLEKACDGSSGESTPIKSETTHFIHIIPRVNEVELWFHCQTVGLVSTTHSTKPNKIQKEKKHSPIKFGTLSFNQQS